MLPHKLKKHGIIIFFSALYLFFVVFKLIVTLQNADFVAINARNALKIENTLTSKKNFSFIAVGNVMNSIGIFQDRMIPMINDSDADFVVFTGDFLIDGGNDKYAALNRMLLHLNKPVLFVFGDREASDRGAGNFFRHMGNPYFFFNADKTQFIFMDTTGYTEESVQIAWLRQILDQSEGFSRRLVFSNRSFIQETDKEQKSENHYALSDSYKKDVLDLFTGASITASVSSSYSEPQIVDKEGIKFIASGGGGGLINEGSVISTFYFTKVSVGENGVTAKDYFPELAGYTTGTTIFDWVWNKIYSWVHVSFLNIILIISLLFFIVSRLYRRLVMRIDYYPDFSAVPDKGRPLTIAMFTNNYLPFIGGVPLSIVRLKKGLEEMGHQVYVFAPTYGDGSVEDDENVIRFSPIFHYRKGELIVPVSNIFSGRIQREFRRINPDIVHVHHPFWMGGVGKRLAARHGKPVVFTYHTRLEQYNHYVPFFHRLAGGQIPHMVIKFFASRCDAVIAPTSSAKMYLRNLGIGKLIVIQPTGIDLKPLPGPTPDAMKGENRIILFSVYRLSNEKSPYFMLEGLEQLSRTTSCPFRCYIAGAGPEEEPMSDWIAKRYMEDKIVLLGKVPPAEITAYYKEADLFIFSSQSETQGMVILEAMAGGTPVVAVDSSGISDIVENGFNGFKTDADLDKWTDKISVLLKDENLRKKLGEQALKTAADNSLEAMCTNILDMYYEIIDWKKRHPDKVFIR